MQLILCGLLAVVEYEIKNRHFYIYAFRYDMSFWHNILYWLNNHQYTDHLKN